MAWEEEICIMAVRSGMERLNWRERVCIGSLFPFTMHLKVRITSMGASECMLCCCTGAVVSRVRVAC